MTDDKYMFCVFCKEIIHDEEMKEMQDKMKEIYKEYGNEDLDKK
jgi:hypothetical protein